MKITPAFYEKFLRPPLFRMDPESAHDLAMFALRAASRSRLLLKLIEQRQDSRLEKRVFGLKFANPVGLAAGFDKNAAALPAWQALGFGFIEAGTVTARGQPGNPKPRIFRFPDQRAVINRLGFNNEGADAVAQRLTLLKKSGLCRTSPSASTSANRKSPPSRKPPAIICSHSSGSCNSAIILCSMSARRTRQTSANSRMAPPSATCSATSSGATRITNRSW